VVPYVNEMLAAIGRRYCLLCCKPNQLMICVPISTSN